MELILNEKELNILKSTLRNSAPENFDEGLIIHEILEKIENKDCKNKEAKARYFDDFQDQVINALTSASSPIQFSIGDIFFPNNFEFEDHCVCLISDRFKNETHLKRTVERFIEENIEIDERFKKDLNIWIYGIEEFKRNFS